MITREKIRDMRKDIDAALKEVAEKHCVTIEAGNASYSSKSFSLKLNITENASDGSTVSQGELDWEKSHWKFGLDKDLFGKTFKTNKGEYEIVGLKPRSYKYPVLGKSLKDGKTYKFPEATVKKATIK